jgi:hypothetical protein
MYIVAIGWLFVVLMMALTSGGITSGLAVLFGYGILPLALFLWVVGTPHRRRRARLREAADEETHKRDGSDAQ